ncbi:antibiotic biosynthesis monooxygenase [Hyphomicrobiales bacterium]|jgi:quinol monooxygenase YgiN|nr:antibiotic biosynthesis monooxygenase [Rhodobiaceae bacterium]MBT5641122.1 antibiotic biosynthesis monooxygenase [Rhodobiaceae bacterium]MBT6223431.1 antibiotic biosynthesis monooxygenase [Rhodobiaceae bacterium]MDB4831961.1 antibiotic biosynthesis monooxygenase [Hyphomicrobiales bacterium]MDC0139237.1 antibiotic biosynthesis monooxygenase [Hyphomicrobiales bacterium]|tara:strand:+ start:673 stop:975 length:303 start_codon:yes stop_codon:yes gene_type:complete
MIIVIGEFRFKADKMDEIRPHMIKVIEASNNEDGCISYAFSESIQSPGLIRVAEKWKSFEDLEQHFKTEHMNNWREAATLVGGSTDRNVAAYEVKSIKEL